VVAAEVRSLALRSADASKEIEELIRQSASQMDAGASLVNTAGSAMSEIVVAVREVQGIMDDIAAASREQANGLAQITLAVGQLDTITQDNAQQVQTAARATLAQQEQADGLAATVARFILSDSGHAAMKEPHGKTGALADAGRRDFVPTPGQLAYDA
jgi:methyl-accepting chemotaxis protein